MKWFYKKDIVCTIKLLGSLVVMICIVTVFMMTAKAHHNEPVDSPVLDEESVMTSEGAQQETANVPTDIEGGVVTIDQTPPVISNISVESTATAATITWTTDEVADAQVTYGTSASYGSESAYNGTLDLSHSITLTNLSPGTYYHFQIVTSDGSSNRTTSADQHFSTISNNNTDPGGGILLPTISGINPHEITDTGVIISWETDVPTTGRIEYGVTTAYGQTTVLDEALVTEHEQTLTSLAPNTAYHLRIYVGDSLSNISISDDYVFTTAQSQSNEAPPIVSDVEVGEVSTSSVLVTWKTDVPATSQVYYGLTSSYGKSSIEDKTLVTSHSQVISDLISNTSYHFQAVSSNAGGTIYSIDDTFITTRLTDVIDLVPPSPIEDLAISEIDQTSLVLTWTAPQDNSGVIFYDINRSDKPLTESNFYDAQVVHETEITVDDIDEVGEKHSYKVVGLNPGSVVYFAIKASDPFDNVSKISNIVSAKTLKESGGHSKSRSVKEFELEDKVAPGKVSNVQVYGLDKLILLSWHNPTDPDFLRVRVVRSATTYPSEPTDGEVVYDGKGDTFSDTDLVNGKTYFYSIFAYDEVPNYSKPVQLSIAPYAERRHYHILRVANNDSEATTKVEISGDFSLGDSSDEVSHVQEILATDPTLYPEGLITGYFGSRTEAAVIKLQQRYNLPETGRTDAATRAVLSELPRSQYLTETTSPGVLKSLSHDLSYGSSGEEVRTLQGYLAEQGLLPATSVTGYFGSQTREAVIMFQIKNNTTPTAGYVGPVTRAKIFENFQTVSESQ